jgi:hypothetical protein
MRHVHCPFVRIWQLEIEKERTKEEEEEED